MKKLNVVGLVLIGCLGGVGMSTSAKADVQKLDVKQMQQVKGGSTIYAQAQAEVKPLSKQEMQSAKGASGFGTACNELHSDTEGECTKMPNGNSYKWIPVDYYTCGKGYPWNKCPDPTSVFDHKIFWYTGNSCGKVNGERASESHICTQGCDGVACIPLDGSGAVNP